MEGRTVMNKNDIFEIEITGMTDDGSGVGRAEGIAVFVPYTIIGETVRVHIIKVNKTYAVGKLIEVVSPSIHRVKSECEYFYKCGGCQLWHMDYEAELDYKYNKVKNCIERIGGISVDISPIVSADFCTRYRNKVQLPVSKSGVGFYMRNSHNVVDIDDCLLQDKRCKEIVLKIKEWIKKLDIEPFDEKTNDGLIKHIYIRSGKSGIIVVIVSKTDKIPKFDVLTEELISLNLNIEGIVCNINPDNTNVVLGRENKIIWGKGSITDNIGETEFKISPDSFYQVNKEQTLKLYNLVAEMADITENDTVWDFYCGIGTIGQFVAKKANKIIGIEIVPQAVEDAKKNAKKNGITNAEYYCGPAEIVAPTLIKKGERADVVILDPPRKGCDEILLDTVIKSHSKRIVYVSCKPSTLARDLKYFNEHGYITKQIVPVDMFPRTCHVECVALLSYA